MTFEKLRTLRQIAQANPVFSEAMLRYYVFNAKTNGLEHAIVRVQAGPGDSKRAKVLIDIDEFNRWLESGRQGRVASTPTRSRKARTGQVIAEAA